MLTRGAILATLLWSVVASAILAADTDINPKLDPNGLPMILERIRGHAEKEEWRKDGWSDATIEKWLENAVAKLGTAAERADLKLPFRFSDVRRAAAPGARGIRGGEQSALLVVGSNVELTHARHVIVLADGNAELAFADNCIILARGVISVAHSNNSLIVSGTLVEIGHDGNGFGGQPNGSVVLCRGRVNISHATGTTILGQEGVSISHAHAVTFVGADGTTSHRDAACKVVKAPASFPVEPRSAHALEKKLQVLGAVRPKGIVFRFEGKRYVADVSSPIVDEAGNEVASLKDWRVTFVGDEAAAFSNGSVDIPLLLPHD